MSEIRPEKGISQAAQYYNEDIRKIEQQIAQIWKKRRERKKTRKLLLGEYYEQNYTQPDDVVRDQISAKVEDGILNVTMPKAEPKQKVTKAIEVSEQNSVSGEKSARLHDVPLAL